MRKRFIGTKKKECLKINNIIRCK